MSRQQMVDTYFWQDPWVQKQKPEKRYFFLYLITNPLANLAGVYEITDQTMATDTGIPLKAVTAHLADFAADKKVYRWESWTIMRNWPKRQNIKNPKIQKGIERILLDLPKELQKFLVQIDYRYPELETLISPVNTLSNSRAIPYAYPMDTLSHLTTLHFTEPPAGQGVAGRAGSEEISTFPQALSDHPFMVELRKKEELFK